MKHLQLSSSNVLLLDIQTTLSLVTAIYVLFESLMFDVNTESEMFS